jgi:hypothetical protein
MYVFTSIYKKKLDLHVLQPSTLIKSVVTTGIKWKNKVCDHTSNMTGTNCDLFTHKSSRSYLIHLV